MEDCINAYYLLNSIVCKRKRRKCPQLAMLTMGDAIKSGGFDNYKIEEGESFQKVKKIINDARKIVPVIESIKSDDDNEIRKFCTKKSQHAALSRIGEFIYGQSSTVKMSSINIINELQFDRSYSLNVDAIIQEIKEEQRREKLSKANYKATHEYESDADKTKKKLEKTIRDCHKDIEERHDERPDIFYRTLTVLLGVTVIAPTGFLGFFALGYYVKNRH